MKKNEIILCNLCDGEMNYTEYKGTHIWLCNHCSNIQLEFIENKDLENLNELLNNKNGGNNKKKVKKTRVFNVDEVVLYQKGTSFELGIVKEVCNNSSNAHICGDCISYDTNCPSKHMYECKYSDFTKVKNKYRIWNHTSDTTILVEENNLHKISNAFAFTLLRRGIGIEISKDPCRFMAHKILYKLNEIIEESYGEAMYDDVMSEYLKEEGNKKALFGNSYYEHEDLITKILKGE